MTDYRPQSDDTAVAIDRQVFDGLRRMTPAERLRLCSQACIAATQLAMAGLRLRHPTATEAELWRRVAALRIGPEWTRRLLGDVLGS